MSAILSPGYKNVNNYEFGIFRYSSLIKHTCPPSDVLPEHEYRDLVFGIEIKREIETDKNSLFKC